MLCEVMTVGSVPEVDPGDGRRAGLHSSVVDLGPDSRVHGRHDGQTTDLGYLGSHRDLGSLKALGRFACSEFAILPDLAEVWDVAVGVIAVETAEQAGFGVAVRVAAVVEPAVGPAAGCWPP